MASSMLGPTTVSLLHVLGPTLLGRAELMKNAGDGLLSNKLTSRNYIASMQMRVVT